MVLPDGAKIDVWEELTDVSAFSQVPRWRWKFPEGTVAFDVLFGPDDRVFEVRTQTKADGEWETKVSYRDGDASPPNYHGAGKACASCHNLAATVTPIPGRIYRHARWGDDGRFSWRPFDESNQVDHRWPVSVAEGVRPSSQKNADADITFTPAFGGYSPMMMQRGRFRR